jgi:hypothetical protein
LSAGTAASIAARMENLVLSSVVPLGKNAPAMWVVSTG